MVSTPVQPYLPPPQPSRAHRLSSRRANPVRSTDRDGAACPTSQQRRARVLRAHGVLARCKRTSPWATASQSMSSSPKVKWRAVRRPGYILECRQRRRRASPPRRTTRREPGSARARVEDVQGRRSCSARASASASASLRLRRSRAARRSSSSSRSRRSRA